MAQNAERRLKTGTIKQKVLIPNSTPASIYKALLSSKEHSEITGSPAKISAVAGRKFSAWDGYITGKNVSLEKGAKIVQEWRTTEFPEGYGPSIVRITLRRKEDSTEISLIQSRVPASQLKKYGEGWYSAYWKPMKKYFKGKNS